MTTQIRKLLLMKLAIQEDMLPGRTEAERYLQAIELGFDGIELWVDGLGRPSDGCCDGTQ